MELLGAIHDPVRADGEQHAAFALDLEDHPIVHRDAQLSKPLNAPQFVNAQRGVTHIVQ